MSSSFLPMTPGKLRPRTRPGSPVWPDFEWVRWPPERPAPTRDDVVATAYAVAGLSYRSAKDRRSVRCGRGPLRSMVLVAAFPILVTLCRCSGSEAAQTLYMRRHLVRTSSLFQAMVAPAGQAITGLAMNQLLSHTTPGATP